MPELNRWVFWPALVGAIFIILPVASLFTGLSLEAVVGSLKAPLVLQALRLSGLTSLVSTGLIILFGLPLAYLLARGEFKGRQWFDTLVDLPMVLPPAVAGVALLMAFGRRGWLGVIFGLSFSFSATAVILAQCFVAGPFFVRAARSGFQAVDPVLEKASLTLGRSPAATFLKITLPLARPALVSGAVMAWARALGEFGATLMFAGNMPGRTQTMPLAIYTAMETNLDAALVLAALLVVVSLAVLLAVRYLGPGWEGR